VLAVVQPTHARYGNEGWGLIIISSLPVRCAAASFLFFSFFFFTHNSPSISGMVQSDMKSLWAAWFVAMAVWSVLGVLRVSSARSWMSKSDLSRCGCGWTSRLQHTHTLKTAEQHTSGRRHGAGDPPQEDIVSMRSPQKDA